MAEKTVSWCKKRSNRWQVTPAIIEEHISLFFEPGSTYFTDVAPKSVSIESIEKGLLKELKSKSIDPDHIKEIGAMEQQ